MTRTLIFGFLAFGLLVTGGCKTIPGLGTELVSAKQESTPLGSNKSIAQEGPSTPIYAQTSLRPSVRPELNTDEAGLWMIVDKMEDKLKTSGNLIRDPKINAYVRKLVCKLAGPFCKDIRTYVVRVPAFNANMMPNGVMQVWTGLILRAQNEAQLSAVLGHEIGHYLRQHGLQRTRSRIDSTNFMIFFQLAVAYVGVPNVGNLAELIAAGSLAAYSRDHERESDKFGHQFLVENGYDPREASKVWRQLIREQEAAKNPGSRSLFLASHPEPEERAETLMRMAKEAIGDGPAGRKKRKEYLEVFGPHRKSFLRDDLRIGRYPQSLELLKILEEEGHNVAEIKFFEGEIYRLRKNKKDMDKALTTYQEALKAGAPPPEIYRSLGQVYLKLEKKAEARASFLQYLKFLPDAPDRMMIQHIIGPTS
ncbi:MAG: M48 family metalloprotease [Rhodospirillales bacterium]|nr:M48 family metalloprotease [Rhodospirillales bacterium]